MFKKSRIIRLGLFTSLLGLLLIFMPFTFALEEKAALDLMFKLRGERQAPDDVVVITVSRESAQRLDLPYDLEKWPRSVHAQLIDILVREGASVIAFDIFFDDNHLDSDDQLFAHALSNAKKVILFEALKRDTLDITDEEGKLKGLMNIDKLLPPVPLFAQSALALAPFPLPKVPVKVSRYWTFKKTAGDVPTLPTTAFIVYSLDVYEDFIHLLNKAVDIETDVLPQSKEEIINTKCVVEVAQAIRYIFKKHPYAAAKMLRELESSEIGGAGNRKKNTLLRSLIKLYHSPGSQFLNFYGGPRSVTTISYDKVVQPHKNVPGEQDLPDFNGKAIFVGISENLELGREDGFYSVYSSEKTGMDISGVEIAATAFANLAEDRPLMLLSLYWQLIIVVLWGFLIGYVSYYRSSLYSAVIMLLMCVCYISVTLHYFETSGTCYPLVVPLFFQMPFAFLGALIWKYTVIHQERQNIKTAFRYYIPDDVIEQLTDNITDFETSNKLVYGTCLYTDAQHFTSLSESMDPESLAKFINKYFEVIFKPVKQHKGVVSNVIGDSMLAIWAALDSDTTVRKEACFTALDIKRDMHQFNQSSQIGGLHTRIAMHSGHILLGNVGAEDHYEYRAIGDIVNTVTRIEGLNKFLGTQILLSEEIVSRVDVLLTRNIGEFVFVGKEKPLVIHELICYKDESVIQERELCMAFALGLEAFRNRAWQKADRLFHEIIKMYGNDGPSSFYIRLCEKYSKNPPDEDWNGTVRLDKK